MQVISDFITTKQRVLEMHQYGEGTLEPYCSIVIEHYRTNTTEPPCASITIRFNPTPNDLALLDQMRYQLEEISKRLRNVTKKEDL